MPAAAPDFVLGNNWEDDGSVGYSYRMHVSGPTTNQQVTRD